MENAKIEKIKEIKENFPWYTEKHKELVEVVIINNNTKIISELTKEEIDSILDGDMYVEEAQDVAIGEEIAEVCMINEEND